MLYINVSKKTSSSVTRRRDIARKGIVLHETIGTDSLDWLQGGSARVGRSASSDFLIHRDGTIYQITQPGYYAFHAGKSRWRLIQDPDYTLNQSFVGIELENHPGRGQKITDPQYIACAAVIRRLLSQHNIPILNLVGHYQVALPHGRKSDPITLDYAILTREMIHPSPEGMAIKFPEVLP